jgi:hypothetical protein
LKRVAHDPQPCGGWGIFEWRVSKDNICRIAAILLLAAFGMTDNKEKEIITALELKTPKEYS